MNGELADDHLTGRRWKRLVGIAFVEDEVVTLEEWVGVGRWVLGVGGS